MHKLVLLFGSMIWMLGADSPSADPITYFLQLGVTGGVIAAILLGLLWAKPAVDQITKRAERAEAQRDALVEIYENKMLPALTESLAINRELRPLVVDLISVLGIVKDQQREQQRRPLVHRPTDEDR